MKPGSLIEGLFDDVREVLQPAALQPTQQASFLDGVRNAITGMTPDTAVKPLESYSPKTEPTKVWGWDDDKMYYTNNEPEPRLDKPADYIVLDNNNNKKMRLQIITTIPENVNTDGPDGHSMGEAISVVRKMNDDGTWDEYKGVDNISNFFRNNFDMDAGNYTVLRESLDDEADGGGYYHVDFDSGLSKNRFIPSQIFDPSRDYNRAGQYGNNLWVPRGYIDDWLNQKADTGRRTLQNLLQQLYWNQTASPLVEVNPKWWKGKDDVTPIGRSSDARDREKVYSDNHPGYWMQWDPSTYEGGYYKGNA